MMNGPKSLSLWLVCITAVSISSPTHGAVVNRSYVFDLDLGTQFEIGDPGSGLSVFRPPTDASQPFLLMNGDTLNVDVSFANGRLLWIRDNGSIIASGLEALGLEIPLDGIRATEMSVTARMTTAGGEINTTELSTPRALGFDLLSPRVADNLTDTFFVLERFSMSATVVSGLPDVVEFDSVTLAVTAGTPLAVVPEPATVALLGVAVALWGVAKRRRLD